MNDHKVDAAHQHTLALKDTSAIKGHHGGDRDGSVQAYNIQPPNEGCGRTI
jgi:hypothetical protein